MADIYSTDVLNTVVASLLGDPQFLLDRYFGTVQTETSEEIHFDVLDGKRLARNFKMSHVKGLPEQCPIVKVEEIAGSRIEAV